MGALRKLQSRVVSFLLALVIMFSSIPQVNAATDINTGDGGGSGSATSSGTKWDGTSFIRVTMLFAENGNWTDGKVYQIGRTIDMCNPDAGPSQAVRFVSNFSNIYETSTGYKITGNTATAYNDGAPLDMNDYGYTAWKDYRPAGVINGTPFPILVGDRANGVDPKSYFEMDGVINEIIYSTQAAMGITQGNIQVDDVKNGIYKDANGFTVYGQYIILLETGIYLTLNGVYTATTTREALLLKEKGVDALSKNIASPYKDSANKLYILKPWYMLRLDGSWGGNSVSSFWGADKGLLRDKFGVGIVEFKSVEKEPIPVVNYYYDLDEEDFTSVGLKIEYETDEKTGEKTAKVVDSEGNQITTYDLMYEYSEVFARKADNAKKISNTNMEYTAKADDGGYQLVSGYMTNKEVVAGNLDIKNNSLGFYDINGAANITEQLKNHTGIADLSEDKVKEWHTSQNLATTVLSNQAVSGLSKLRHIEQDTDGGLTASFGNGIDSLQAVFLGIYYG